VPGLASQAAAVLAAFHLGRPPAEADRPLVMTLAYVCLALVVLPVLFGGKIYRMMLAVMTAKVFIVLGCTLAVGVVLVSPANWQHVFSGFLKFGEVPVAGPEGREVTVNALAMYFTEGVWPAVSLANIAVLGAFAGYAGGGGLGNSMYSNYVRDQGWGMGSRVGAIPSAIGGKHISLSHLGKVFPINAANLDRWKRWWKYIVADQLIVWAPGCFVGMALPALLSLQFAPYSPLYSEPKRLDWAQAVISADGLRNAPGLSAGVAQALWVMMLFVGLMVLLPSQMSVVEDVSRRWTDVIWSGSRRVRERMAPHQVSWIYYSILTCYVIWSAISMYVFTTYGSPKLMTLVISNLGNVALGFTSFFLLWVNYRLLPAEIQPRWYHRVGVAACGVFYLGMALLVFTEKQWPMIRELFGRLI
jgi:hypothetical protein